MSSNRPKKSVLPRRGRYRPELLELENRVVPSASATGLDSFLVPAPAASLPVMKVNFEVQVFQDEPQTGKVQELSPGARGIGNLVGAEVQIFSMGHQGKGFQGIGQELSLFIFNIFPSSTGQ